MHLLYCFICIRCCCLNSHWIRKPKISKYCNIMGEGGTFSEALQLFCIWMHDFVFIPFNGHGNAIQLVTLRCFTPSFSHLVNVFYVPSLRMTSTLAIETSQPKMYYLDAQNLRHSTIQTLRKLFCISFFLNLFSHVGKNHMMPRYKIEILRDKLTVIIVNIIVAIHFQLNGAIETRPAFNAYAFIFAILECTLSMTWTSIFATSFRELTGREQWKRRDK